MMVISGIDFGFARTHNVRSTRGKATPSRNEGGPILSSESLLLHKMISGRTDIIVFSECDLDGVEAMWSPGSRPPKMSVLQAHVAEWQVASASALH